ncbi:GDP-D-glucose phosphorylase 1 isoform X1 [Xenopus laevis]|uniref:GDP-D-glucose phosphorylase 1 n=3 Tax=Xenopus laevis TaxID=8355 RepID=GDPP1_XENLA|nr:GDP-D-glucose phosphorylase 1 [Xenopus laevis]XP_041443380.1 GDP-D-glucose phosphorylase 1 isoform X1 [Xenopus laevis]XP_041443381.1 GDP-D-glucose phosphorylase 1 isoform X1 [Xenopus laevis]A8E5Y3.1 RecName: Full=GDP-D-glucose phosphorylase 1 [Xenopus laevis]AAI53763.1 LOC100126619 protein [Xenopus laevis]AAI69592.1 UPF0580 protein [Xenopus laevis]OCT86850.1 hypothetical protein XELAEV_18020540mg [Xenopus laevis]
MEEEHINQRPSATVEEYSYSEADFVFSGLSWKERRQYAEDTSFLSPFDKALQSKWEQKMNEGLFRYPLRNLQTKILPGSLSYVAQLNIQRSINRRKPEDIWSIQQKFNPNQFNYNKIKPEEIVFQMIRSETEHCVDSDKVHGSSVNGMGTSDCKSGSTHQRCCILECKGGCTLVVINVSPLEFGHVLFMPDPSLCLPQILTEDLMLFGLESVLLSAHPGFRVGFNSLGGFASVNHLHLHGFYLDHDLFIESSSSKPLCPEMNFHLITHFPAPSFLFYTDGRNLKSTAQNICKVTDFLVAKNIAHNLFITRGSNPDTGNGSEGRNGIRVNIWARKPSFGAKEVSAFNVALCELAGHLPVKNQEDFNSITEDSVIDIIHNCLLADDEFTQLSLDLVEYLRK